MDTQIPKQEQIISLIVSLADPDQIILFGSYARGEAKSHSDVDLLVVKRGVTNPWRISGELHYAFCINKIGIPIDIIVVDYNEYIEMKDRIGYVYREINQEGKLLYGRL